MAYWTLERDYIEHKEKYDKYLDKSRLVRLLGKIFTYMLIFGLFLMVLGEVINVEPANIRNPVFTFDYIYTVAVSFFIFGGFLGAIIVDRIHNRIKEACSFDKIKIDFIHMYEASISYDKYLQNKIPVDKNDAIDHIDKCLKIIKDWEIGNIPFIMNKFETQIEFIQNKFRGITLHLLNSYDNIEIRDAKVILYLLSAFLLYNDEERLNEFYEYATKYKGEEVAVWEITTKDKVGIYIQNHQVISQSIFTGSLLIGLYYLGVKMEATDNEMLTWFLVLIPASLPVFKWVKETVFQIEK